MRKWQKIATVKDRRRHGRSVVLLRARIQAADGDVSGFVRNLSQTGAMMDAHHDLEVDMKVTLNCGGMAMLARVAWVEERRLGIQFSVPIDEATVAMMVAPRNEALAGA